MSFTVAVSRTVNGKLKIARYRDWPEESRAEIESTIARFEAGEFPMEHVYMISWGPSRETPDGWRSWRWADVKKIEIEES